MLEVAVVNSTMPHRQDRLKPRKAGEWREMAINDWDGTMYVPQGVVMSPLLPQALLT